MKNVLQTIFFYFLISISCFAQGYLGVVIKDYKQENIEGARVINILDDGAAKLAGIKENDVIISYNNFSTPTKDDLIKILKQSNWGDAVKLEILRAGEVKYVQLHLGYKKDTKTYQLHKKQINQEQHWFFEDDNTIVVLDKNEKPISIEKKENDCLIDKWYIGEAYRNEEMPQCFLDLEDKLFAIKRIKLDQARRNVSIDYITYIRTLVETDSINKEKEQNKDLSLETFSIFPNPNNGQFTVKIETSNFSPFNINLFDVTGKKIIQEYVGTFEGTFLKQYDFRTLARGSYLIQVVQNEKIVTKKILIQ